MYVTNKHYNLFCTFVDTLASYPSSLHIEVPWPQHDEVCISSNVQSSRHAAAEVLEELCNAVLHISNTTGAMMPYHTYYQARVERRLLTNKKDTITGPVDSIGALKNYIL